MVGGVAGGAFAGPVVNGRLVTGAARGSSVAVVERGVSPTAAGVAGGAGVAIMGQGGGGGVAGGAVAGRVVLVTDIAPVVRDVAGGAGGGVMAGGWLVTVAAGFSAGICRVRKPGISPPILIVASAALPFIMPGRGICQMAILAVAIASVVEMYRLPGVAVVAV